MEKKNKKEKKKNSKRKHRKKKTGREKKQKKTQKKMKKKKKNFKKDLCRKMGLTTQNRSIWAVFPRTNLLPFLTRFPPRKKVKEREK